MAINEKDLKIDRYRDVRINSSVVQVIHVPSGIAVSSHEERSDHANKVACIESIERILAARVADGECPLNLSGVRAVKARVEAEISEFLIEKLTELANETGVFATSATVVATKWINQHTGKVEGVTVSLDRGRV